MATVKPGGLSSGDEELTAISVRSCIGHREAERLVVELEVFVIELGPPDRPASGSVSVGEVTALDHKVRDDSVESTTCILQEDSIVNEVSLAQLSEVLNGLWHN